MLDEANKPLPSILDSPISKNEVLKYGNKWRPYRSVATWYLWRSLDPIPVEY